MVKTDPRRAAFTLLEIMVVVVIIAIITAVAVLSLSGGGAQALRAEGERLRNALQLAADEAVFEGTQTSVAFSENSYVFLRLDAAQKNWQRMDDSAMREHRFSSNITLALTQDGKNIPVAKTTSVAATLPALLFFSSGEMTPFTLTLSADGATLSLTGDGINPIRLSTTDAPQ